jgi:adenylate cyclase
MSVTTTEEPGALRYLRHPLVVLIALGGGAAVGLFARGVGISLMPVGRVYLFLLQMTLIPILVFAIATGVAELVRQPRSGRLLLRGIAVLAVVFAVAASIALAAGIIGHPGRGLGQAKTAYLAQLIRGTSTGTDLSVSLSAPSNHRRASLLDLVAGIVPRNIFESLSAGSAVQAAVFALLFGLAIGLLREKQRDYLIEIGLKALNAFKKLNLWLIYALPLGAVALVSSQLASSGTGVLWAILRFLSVMGIAMAAGMAFFILAAWRRTGRPFRIVISALVEPLTYAFITGDSLISIPYALRSMELRLGYRRETANAAVPLAMTVGRAGTALFFVLAGIFAADFYGVQLYAADCVILAVGSVIAALAASGNTAAGSLAMLGLALAPVALPVEPVAAVFTSAAVLIGPLVAVFETQANLTASVFIARRAEAPDRLRAAPPVRRISLRASILTLLASLIVLTGLVTMGLTYSGQRRNISFLADEMIGEISDRVMQRTVNHFGPAERALSGLRYLLQGGLIDASNRRALIDLMRNEVSANPEFAAVYFGDASGGFTMVKRMPDGSLSNRIITRRANAVDVTWEHGNPQYAESFPSAMFSLSEGYDPRTRGWYRNAVKEGRQIWTGVYLFASDNMLGVSNAVPIYRRAVNDATRAPGSEEPAGVLAVDIGVAELSYFLGSLDVSENGRAYILNEKNDLVALSVPMGSDLSALFSGAPTGSAGSTANLISADEAQDTLVRQSFLSYLRAPNKDRSFSLKAGGQRYLSRIVAFPQNGSFKWKIGIVIPEARIYAYVNQTSRIVLYTAVLIILVAIGLGVNFSRAITLPLRRLSREMERIRNFDLGGHDVISSRILEVHNMTDAFANMKQGLSAFSKYVPSKLVAQLVRLGEEPRIGGQRRNITLLFSDVADFTTISEQLSPEALVDQMAIYFNALSGVIMKYRGTVDKYIGDAIMAFWNAPVPVEDHPVMACLSAIACQEALRRLQSGAAKGAPPGRASPPRPASLFSTRTRIGIHTGDVIVGNMGSEERLNYTAIGDSVNVASRLEGLNKNYGTSIIISETTYANVKQAVVARLLDRVAVKGRHGGIQIYELLGPIEGLSRERVEFAELSTRAVESYLNRGFDQAVSLINAAGKIIPEDQGLAMILKRCEAFLETPPPPDWNGVYIYHEK